MQPAKNTGRAADKARKLAEYDAWYAEQIQLGLDDIEAGRVVSHEDVMAASKKRLASLEKKHGKKAA